MHKEKVDMILREKTQNKELKANQIRTKLKDMQHKRKLENRLNKKAYYAMIAYMRARSVRVVQPELPSSSEIAILEVFKKLVESGWIVKQPEFR